MTGRIQRFDALDNFRDYGDYASAAGRRIAGGRLFRSAHHARASDAERARMVRETAVFAFDHSGKARLKTTTDDNGDPVLAYRPTPTSESASVRPTGTLGTCAQLGGPATG